VKDSAEFARLPGKLFRINRNFLQSDAAPDVFSGHGGFVAADIGGTNFRAGIVAIPRKLRNRACTL
jgi:hypothetical protein